MVSPLSPYLPTQAFDGYLTFIHSATGTPWAASIFIAALGVRCACFPLQYYSMHILHTLHRLKGHFAALQFLVQKETKDDARRKTLIKETSSKLLKAYGAQKWKVFAPHFMQIPFFVTFAIATRNMMGSDEAIAKGGILWFPHLVVPDATWVLPAIAVGMSYASIEIGGLANVNKTFVEEKNAMDPNSLGAKLGSAFQMIMIGMFPLMTQLPAGIFMYWIGGTSFHVALSLLLRFTNLRMLLGFDKEPFPLEFKTENSFNKIATAQKVVKVVKSEFEATAADAVNMGYGGKGTRGKAKPDTARKGRRRG